MDRPFDDQSRQGPEQVSVPRPAAGRFGSADVLRRMARRSLLAAICTAPAAITLLAATGGAAANGVGVQAGVQVPGTAVGVQAGAGTPGSARTTVSTSGITVTGVAGTGKGTAPAVQASVGVTTPVGSVRASTTAGVPRSGSPAVSVSAAASAGPAHAGAAASAGTAGGVTTTVSITAGATTAGVSAAGAGAGLPAASVSISSGTAGAPPRQAPAPASSSCTCTPVGPKGPGRTPAAAASPMRDKVALPVGTSVQGTERRPTPSSPAAHGRTVFLRTARGGATPALRGAMLRTAADGLVFHGGARSHHIRSIVDPTPASRRGVDRPSGTPAWSSSPSVQSEATVLTMGTDQPERSVRAAADAFSTLPDLLAGSAARSLLIGMIPSGPAGPSATVTILLMAMLAAYGRLSLRSRRLPTPIVLSSPVPPG